MAIPAALAAQLTPEQLAALEAAMAPSAFGQYPQPIPQQMLPYTPSVTDRIRMGASDLFGNDPVGRRRQGMVNRSVDNLTPLPVLDILRDAQEQYDRGGQHGDGRDWCDAGRESVSPYALNPWLQTAEVSRHLQRARAIGAGGKCNGCA